VAKKLCKEEEIGAFILSQNATEKSINPIISKAVHLKDAAPINYPVRRTGYYCVATYAYTDDDYRGVVEFRNSYGELPAAQIAKLPFYGGLTIVYAVIGVYVRPKTYLGIWLKIDRFWGFLYFQNRHDIRE
jgi:hypothetical protein